MNIEPMIETKYIPCFDMYKKILEYSPSDGRHRELNRAELAENTQLAHGYYVKAGNEYIGVYASPEGPVCFRGRVQYVLSEGNYTSDLRKGEEENLFTFFLGDEELFSVTYVRPLANWDVWATEEMVDFFLWLHLSLTAPSPKNYFFRKAYTQRA